MNKTKITLSMPVGGARRLQELLDKKDPAFMKFMEDEKIISFNIRLPEEAQDE
jgi:hypothetical protein